MKLFTTIATSTALLGTKTMSAEPEAGWLYSHEVDLKMHGTFEADAKVELDAFTKHLREKQGQEFDMDCAEACFRTPGCRFDPHQHWSYCKYDHHPPTCFGLYHNPRHHHRRHHRHQKEEGDMMHSELTEWGWGKGRRFGRLCYQPTQPGCPQDRPVLCRRHRMMERDMQPHMDGEYESDLI
jgi:hypothetical protein